MMEYEDIAHKSILKLQKQQEGEVRALSRLMNKDPSFKVNFSQDLIQLR